MTTESEARQLTMTAAEQQAFLAGNVISYIGLFLLQQNPVPDLLKAKEKLDELIAIAVWEKARGEGSGR